MTPTPQSSPPGPRTTLPLVGRLAAGTIAAAALALTATACTPPQGPTGRVTNKSWYLVNKHPRHYLTVRTTNGTDHRFRVTHHDYTHCMRGSSYPHCTTAERNQ